MLPELLIFWNRSLTALSNPKFSGEQAAAAKKLQGVLEQFNSARPAQPAPAAEAGIQLLLSTLTDVVVEMVEAKCQTITNRERKTLERRIDKALRLFVQGQKPKT